MSVLKAFLAEMKVKFTTTKQEAEDTQMTEEAFYARIDLAIKQAEAGEGTLVKTSEELHTYLDSL